LPHRPTNPDKFLGTELRKVAFSLVVSVRPSAWNNSAPTGRVFIKFLTFEYFSKLEKIEVSLKSDSLTQ